MSRPTAIQIQEFAPPTITAADHAMVNRGYRASMAKRGLDVDTDGFGGRFLTAAQRQAKRRALALMLEDDKQTERGEA